MDQQGRPGGRCSANGIVLLFTNGPRRHVSSCARGADVYLPLPTLHRTGL